MRLAICAFLGMVASGGLLAADYASTNVCSVQDPESASKANATGESGGLVRVRGKAIFSAQGFWTLTEPGCSPIPIAEVLQDVNPRPNFTLVKDENYRLMKDLRWRSRQQSVSVEVEGRLDRIQKGLRNSWRSGSAGLHIAKFDTKLVLHRVISVQVEVEGNIGVQHEEEHAVKPDPMKPN